MRRPRSNCDESARLAARGAPGLRRADGRPIGIANMMRVLKMGANATSIEAPSRL
jgi:hypothetical protein